MFGVDEMENGEKIFCYLIFNGKENLRFAQNDTAKLVRSGFQSAEDQRQQLLLAGDDAIGPQRAVRLAVVG